MAKIRYRLGLDLGANSLGWCVYRLNETDEPEGIVRLGARIFSDGRDPKTLASRAADRRQARQMRRRRDRLLKRRRRLMEALVRFGLMPGSEADRKALLTEDPFELRARGLDQPLAPHQIGRALFHLCRKRGFKSSRKDRSQDEKETGKVKAAIAALRDRIGAAGCRTVGEYLAKEHAVRKPVRARRQSDGQYVLYLQRDMVAEEFDALWTKQAEFHPALLTDEARDYLRDTLLFQRKLLPVRPGRCLFETDEPRARLSSPLQQKFRILQELNNLRLIDGVESRPLTLQQRNRLYEALRREPRKTLAKLRELAGFKKRDGVRFNLETENRKDLKGDMVSAQLSRADCLGEEWFDWPSERQEALATLLAEGDDADFLIATLRAPPWSFPPARAEALAGCKLPEDFGSLSLKALRKIVPELEREVVTYDEAVRRAGYRHHSELHTGEIFMALPYYGEVLRGHTAPAEKAGNPDEREFGKIPNPTVHIGLNQLRQLVNALVRRYGQPRQIVIEMTREFGLGGERRRELLKTQRDNEERNLRHDERLEALGIRPSRENRLKLRLWEELGSVEAMQRTCPYSGTPLNEAMLFSDEVEVDHVLPFSRSLHDGIGNKVLCTRQANRDKGNRTPFEAFGHSPGAYSWDEILARAENLPGRKPLLFRQSALEDFLGQHDFLARHLSDTAYLSRAAKQYLSYVCHKDQVWVSTGKLTGMIRGKFGLNRLLSEDSAKNRDDHRHHALDAAVIGLCSRSLVQRISRAAARAESRGEGRLLEGLELPWPTFREELAECLSRVVVSHKPDHGREAALHNDTNYGARGPADRNGAILVGRRVPVETLQESDLAKVANPDLRERLRAVLRGVSGTKDTRAALTEFSTKTGVRRVVLEERLSVIPIRDRRTSEPYRFVKGDGNYCYRIISDSADKWSGEVVSYFEANQRGFDPKARFAANGKPIVMQLHKDDLLAIELASGRRVVRIARFSNGMIALVDHHEANVDARTRDKTSGLKYLFKAPNALRPLRARVVGVDILGYVNDPGFRG